MHMCSDSRPLPPIAGTNSAELSHSFKVSDRRRKDAEIGPESFAIVVYRFVAPVPDFWGLVWLRFRPKSGSTSKISGRILKQFSEPF